MAADTTETQRGAQSNLLMHFTPAARYESNAPLIMVRGDGCWLHDEQGNKYFDALAGLYCVQIGYSYGGEIGEAVARQMADLPFASNWSRAHKPSVELATRLSDLAPGPLQRVFFTSGGSESVEAAIKLTRQFHRARQDNARIKIIARRAAYHGTTHGALSVNGVTAFRSVFEPLMYGVRHVSNTQPGAKPTTPDELTDSLLDELRQTIMHEDPRTIAALIIEPMQNSGGSLVPPKNYCEGVRDLCDEFGILLIADEVITGFGRLGEWFGSARHVLQPDIIAFAKGVASAYQPLGGIITTSKVADKVVHGPDGMFLHGVTYGGHPVACAAALKNLQIIEREDVIENVRRNEPYFKSRLGELTELKDVVEVRGEGYHYTIELTSDRTNPAAAKNFALKRLEPALERAGMLTRTGVYGDGSLYIQLAPPLIATEADIDLMTMRVSAVLRNEQPAHHLT